MNEEAHPWREDLGAYLVGALEAEEADRMRRHLEECAACRAEYAELAPVANLLATVPVEAFSTEEPLAHAPDPAMWDRLRARAGLPAEAAVPSRQARPTPTWAPSAGSGPGTVDGRPAGRSTPRRSHRPLRPVAAAAISGVLVAGAFTGVYLGVHRDGGPGYVAGTETFSAADVGTGVSGTVQYRPADWGSWVQITLKGVKPGDDCVLYAMDGSGDKAVASTWWAPPTGQSATIPGGVSMQASAIKNFQVRTTVGEVLLTIPAS